MPRKSNSEKPLTLAQERAAAMVASCQMSHVQIADQLGIGTDTLTCWKRLERFQARVQKLTEEAAKAFGEDAVTNKRALQRFQNRRWHGYQRIMEERAQEAIKGGDAMKFPGASTGLCVPEYSYHKDGTVRSVTWRLDAQLAQAMDRLDQLVGHQEGFCVAKHEVSGPNGTPVQIATTSVPHFGIGLAADVVSAATEIKDAGRWPRSHQESLMLAQELSERLEAARIGLPVPGWESRFSLTEAKAVAIERQGELRDAQ